MGESLDERIRRVTRVSEGRILSAIDEKSRPPRLKRKALHDSVDRPESSQIPGKLRDFSSDLLYSGQLLWRAPLRLAELSLDYIG